MPIPLLSKVTLCKKMVVRKAKTPSLSSILSGFLDKHAISLLCWTGPCRLPSLLDWSMPSSFSAGLVHAVFLLCWTGSCRLPSLLDWSMPSSFSAGLVHAVFLLCWTSPCHLPSLLDWSIPSSFSAGQVHGCHGQHWLMFSDTHN